MHTAQPSAREVLSFHDADCCTDLQLRRFCARHRNALEFYTWKGNDFIIDQD